MYLIIETYGASIGSYPLILETILKSCITPEQVFSFCVENEMSCIIICHVYLIIALLSETKYGCTSQSDNDFFSYFFTETLLQILHKTLL